MDSVGIDVYVLRESGILGLLWFFIWVCHERLLVLLNIDARACGGLCNVDSSVVYVYNCCFCYNIYVTVYVGSVMVCCMA